jgi:hypothetical protein
VVDAEGCPGDTDSELVVSFFGQLTILELNHWKLCNWKIGLVGYY